MKQRDNYQGLAALFVEIKKYSDNTFDRVECAYAWLSDHHEGQYSDSYRDLCILGEVFKPGYMWATHKIGCMDGYNALCDLHGCNHEELEAHK